MVKCGSELFESQPELAVRGRELIKWSPEFREAAPCLNENLPVSIDPGAGRINRISSGFDPQLVRIDPDRYDFLPGSEWF